ncbi:MAG TPA: phosphatase PAP2 family protein [Gemmatimonadales bacterium]|nr:phosphatase PAP2 family protein [Gemmatimonadales bacterium]
MFRFRRALLLFALATSPPGRALAAQAGDRPYRVGWPDAVAIGTGGALALLPFALKLPKGPPPCAPCDPNTLSGFDRVAVHRLDVTADRASTLLLLGAGGAAALGTVWGQDRREAFGNAVVFADAITWAAAADQWLKVTVHRSRPALYTSAAPEAANIRDNRESFPSGHAELAFAAATAYTVIAHRRRLPHATRNAVILYAAAAIVGTLRVVAARHFPTDVIAGAALGSAVSWAAVTVHP